MKVLKLLLGIGLLVIGLYLAGGFGSKLAGGESRIKQIGTVRIDYEIKGE